jgi:hypothetical protein
MNIGGIYFAAMNEAFEAGLLDDEIIPKKEAGMEFTGILPLEKLQHEDFETPAQGSQCQPQGGGGFAFPFAGINL